MLVTQIHLTPRLRISGAMPLLPLYTFMLSTETTLPFLPSMYIHTRKCFSLICDNSVTTQNLWFFQEKILSILKCYNFLWVQRRHNCPPAASFANCVMRLYLLKVQLQTFLSIPITQKCQILGCDTLVANDHYIDLHPHVSRLRYTWLRNTDNIWSFWFRRSSFWPVS